MGRKKSESDRPLWMQGKRYLASLQTAHDPFRYKDFFDSDTLNEAQMMANNAAEREKRKAIVFDRYRQEIVFRCDFPQKNQP